MLVDQIALVTGASRGIGQAIAAALGAAGATVIGTATSQGGVDNKEWDGPEEREDAPQGGQD